MESMDEMIVDTFSFEEYMSKIWLAGRAVRPLVHCYTNVVAAQDTANVALLCGASPMMADALEEAAEITGKAHGLLLNLGMPQPEKVRAILVSLQTALQTQIPVLIDPVGVGVSGFRKGLWLNLCQHLIAAQKTVSDCNTPPFTVLRGNRQEIAICYQLTKTFLTALDKLQAGRSHSTEHEQQPSVCPLGSTEAAMKQLIETILAQKQIEQACLDAELRDIRQDEPCFEEQALYLAKKLHCFVISTEKTDRVFSAHSYLTNSTGTGRMKDLTATGCMLDVFLLSFLSFIHAYKAAGGLFAEDMEEELFYAKTLHLALQMYGEAGFKAAQDEGGERIYLGRFHARLFDYLEKEREDFFLQTRNVRVKTEREVIGQKLHFYAITPSYLLTAPDLALAQIEASLLNGVTCLQMRVKEGSPEAKLNMARKLRHLTMLYDVCFLINDDVELCRACGADGVHLGAEDMHPLKARELLGQKAVIGATAHCWQEAICAANGNFVDYLGCGDVFGTKSKVAPPRLSSGELRKITQAQLLPVVAIGGIQKENIKELAGTGISGVAVISALYTETADIDEVAQATQAFEQELLTWLK